ncbi:MAG: DinB family protein [Ketobacteraceae bacterium]|nr:DinB family protein [Ketobacteraceae bacterium]
MAKDLFITYAKYNQWMNRSIYTTCKALGQDAIEKDQGAFFGSILRTLNHLLIADIFWLTRCSGDASLAAVYDAEGNAIRIRALDQLVYADIEELGAARAALDDKIIGFVESLPEDALKTDIQYRTSQGQTLANPLDVIMLHWFNHQTHHRGQITTLLTQQGAEVGLTDLIYIKDLVN